MVLAHAREPGRWENGDRLVESRQPPNRRRTVLEGAGVCFGRLGGSRVPCHRKRESARGSRRLFWGILRVVRLPRVQGRPMLGREEAPLPVNAAHARHSRSRRRIKGSTMVLRVTIDVAHARHPGREGDRVGGGRRTRRRGHLGAAAVDVGVSVLFGGRMNGSVVAAALPWGVRRDGR